MNVIFQLV